MNNTQNRSFTQAQKTILVVVGTIVLVSGLVITVRVLQGADQAYLLLSAGLVLVGGCIASLSRRYPTYKR